MSGPVVLLVLNHVPLHQGQLGQRKDHGQGHCAPDLECNPEVGGLGAPHKFVQACQKEEEEPPSKGQFSPALVIERKRGIKHVS